MRIGIDIDDTVTNSSDTFIKYAIQYNKEKKITHEIDSTTLDTKKSFGWEKENVEEFLNKYLEELLRNVDAKKESIKIINQLKQEGNEIYFITARSEREIKGEMFKLTEEWLKNNNYQYDLLEIDSHEKEKSCKKYGIDIFIDDSYKNCTRIKKELNIPTLLYATRYNNTVSKDLIRVNNWFEIYDFIKKERKK